MVAVSYSDDTYTVIRFNGTTFFKGCCARYDWKKITNKTSANSNCVFVFSLYLSLCFLFFSLDPASFTTESLNSKYILKKWLNQPARPRSLALTQDYSDTPK